MSLRTFYALTILFPLVGLLLVAALYHPNGGVPAGLGPGATVQWLYPTSASRGLLAFGVVAVWLLWALYRRSPAAFERLLWLAPLAYVGAHVLVLAPLVLMQAQAAEFFEDEGGLMALRLLVRLVVAFGYVGLVLSVRRRLWPGTGHDPEQDRA